MNDNSSTNQIQEEEYDPRKIHLAYEDWDTWYQSLKKIRHAYVDILVIGHLRFYFRDSQKVSARTYITSEGNVKFSIWWKAGYRGDEDGFGVEPDEYVYATVAPDGTYIDKFMPEEWR